VDIPVLQDLTLPSTWVARVEPCPAGYLGGNAGIMTDALSLAGTFHGMGSTAA